MQKNVKNWDAILIMSITLVGIGIVLLIMGAIIIYDVTVIRETIWNHLSTPIIQ